MRRVVGMVCFVAATFGLVGFTAQPSYAAGCGQLSVGATGHCVSDVQYILNEINSAFGETGASYKPVPPQLATDGIYGSATSFTVGHYQAWKHVPVNGITHLIPEWGWWCNEAAVSDWVNSPFLILRQAAFAAVDAGCVLHP